MSDTTKVATNYLKVRDDRERVEFQSDMDGKPTGAKERFEIDSDPRPRWAEGGTFSLADLRSRVEPWLTALFQSEHLSMLAGSGLTTAVHYIAQGSPAAGMGGNIGEGDLVRQIDAAARKSAEAAGRATGNIEDKIRIANELLRGYEILEKEHESKELREAIKDALRALAKDVLTSECGIVMAKGQKRGHALGILVTFLASFASRTGTRDRLHIFTTNYDRLIEAGAELAGIHLLDRFVGSLTPIFRSSRLDLDMHYNPPGIRGEPRYLEGVVRFTKLHGSLDWVQVGREIRRLGLPFGAESVEPFLMAPGLAGATAYELMIYPNAAKDRETAGFPYVELFRDLAAAVCRPNSTLVTYGYGFGDEHINRVIEDMLTIPSTHMVIISHDDKMNRMRELALKRPAQVSLLIGPALADLSRLANHFLPKAAIDRATSRMSELLKSRFGAVERDAAPSAPSSGDQPLPAIPVRGEP